MAFYTATPQLARVTKDRDRPVFAAVAFALAVTLSIHAFVIRRSHLLSFLLKGMPIRKAEPLPAGATAPAAAS